MDTEHTLLVATTAPRGQPGEEGIFRVTLSRSDPKVEHLGVAGMEGTRGPIVDCCDPDILYTWTGRDGVWRSEDAGATWQCKSDGLVYREMWSLAQHLTTGVLYAGTGPAAVFRSDDRGESWQECRQLRTLPEMKPWTFPGPPFVAHVKHIGLCEMEPDAVYGAVEEGWLIRSLDGGRTWRNLQEGIAFDNHSVTVMPDNPEVLVCTAGIGVFRSKDRGESFVESVDGLERRYMAWLAVHPDNPKRLFTAAAEVPPPFWRRPEGASGAFYRSDDQGETWHKLTGGLPEWSTAACRAVQMDQRDPNRVWYGLTDGTVWTTGDGGASFEVAVEGLPPVSGICAYYR